MEKKINTLVSHVKVLEIENNYLRNRIKEFKDTGISV
jgi:regulator of replication initiation timing